jgi:hypothetical protein
MASTEIDCLVRVFQLHRDVDQTGFSGTGVVACLDDIRTVHGHGGATRVVLLADQSKGSAAWTAV